MNIESEIQNQNNDKDIVIKKPKLWKLLFVVAFIIIGFGLIIARLVQVQIIDSDKYKQIAAKQHQTKIIISAKRGNIYDRNGNLIVTSIQAVSLAIDPKMWNKLDKDTSVQIKNSKAKLISILKNEFNISLDSVFKNVDFDRSEFIWLSRGISPDKIAQIDSLNLKCLIKITEPKRSYLYGSIASQIVGATNVDNFGICGIEQKWDSILRGKPGSMIVLRDAFGNLKSAAELPFVPAIDGNGIELTIDIELQRAVEHELKNGVESSKAISGTVLAMDPNTGEILAMASYPTFSPSNLANALHENMRIRAITDVYEPGSTFKLITAASAIEEKILKSTDTLDGNMGQIMIGDALIKDSHPMGRITLEEAFEQSSNVIFSKVAAMIPDYKFYKYLRDFGFGIPVGIDLYGEVSGKVKKPNEFEVNAKKFMGYGYGLSVTPLQILNAYSAVANGGTLKKPYILKKMFDYGGEDLYNAKPENIRRVISQETSGILNNMLCKVIEGKNGTAKLCKINNMRIAGKTGTSKQLIEGRYAGQYYASFAGFFPAQNPQVAMIVILDRPQGDYYGGSIAAPIFKKIALKWTNSNYNSLKYVFAGIDKRNYYQDSLILPNYTGYTLADADYISSYLNINNQINHDSNGVIYYQSIQPNSIVPKNTNLSFQYIPFKNPNDSLTNTQMPNLKGLSSRKAFAMLHAIGIKVKIIGKGKVYNQVINKNKDNSLVCTIYCN